MKKLGPTDHVMTPDQFDKYLDEWGNDQRIVTAYAVAYREMVRLQAELKDALDKPHPMSANWQDGWNTRDAETEYEVEKAREEAAALRAQLEKAPDPDVFAWSWDDYRAWFYAAAKLLKGE